MHVASLELCRELYDLSQWTTGIVLHNVAVVDSNGNTLQDNWGTFPESIIKPSKKSPPAYDLGFLLQKLPEEYFLYRRGDWCVGSYELNDWLHADTPENAVCQMLIELFKTDGFRKVKVI